MAEQTRYLTALQAVSSLDFCFAGGFTNARSQSSRKITFTCNKAGLLVGKFSPWVQVSAAA